MLANLAPPIVLPFPLAYPLSLANVLMLRAVFTQEVTSVIGELGLILIMLRENTTSICVWLVTNTSSVGAAKILWKHSVDV